MRAADRSNLKIDALRSSILTTRERALSQENFKEFGIALQQRPRNLEPISNNDVSGVGAGNNVIQKLVYDNTRQPRNRTIGASSYAGGVADHTIL